ncbi:MAG: DUF2793 domain-containing protein [Labrys sp. (in: a-proteobacteria)]
MSETPRLGLTYLEAAQAQKHVTLNEALRRLDVLVQITVLDRDLATPPATPANGSCYLVPSGATGVFAGHEGAVAAFQDGAWTFMPAGVGWLVFVADENRFIVRREAGWSDLPVTLQNVPLLGIGTTADPVNPLAAKIENALFCARPAAEGGSGDIRLKLNKEAVADTASFLFQSGWSGRAEIGLSGDDDLHLKVSADGSAWTEALVVTAATGRVAFSKGALRSETTVFAASGTFTRPDWARRIRVEAIGGGGGGGGGGLRDPAVAAGGGGGGAGGLIVVYEFEAVDVPASVAVTIGAGGSGGGGTAALNGNGGTGGNGGATGFGALLQARGGLGGAGGGATGGAGGNAQPFGTSIQNGSTAGGAGGLGAVGGAGETTLGAGSSGPGAGAGGGGVSTANAPFGGGSGGGAFKIGGSVLVTAATPGSGAGQAGAVGAGKSWSFGAGAGGSGGGASVTGSAGPGGAGGGPGGGGGGGGAARNGFVSGAGGAGAAGELRVICLG